MKEASSSVWTFQMVIVFMLIFAGFLALVLTYSKAYIVKNRLLSIIEKNSGITYDSINILNNYAINSNYKATAECPTDTGHKWYGVRIYDNIVEEANAGSKYNYCFSGRYDTNGRLYYEIQVFYKFSLPFFQTFGLYRIEGQSTAFSPANDVII